ncbi:pleckstrin homology domain-containing family G member 3 isoform X2 [Harmonia axyridis]|uniref:pleckstrin homology domain-containing family G member 3 isoform X2 n=1 Tax=Harmonia axyridis TaxID=115357 RepID=UPI001E2750FE|nr:pleckstrin homology domain-containing family G member 3 isoform X2 [Harmonia axyridis]
MCTNSGFNVSGTSTELMPCIMGAFDSIIEEGKHQTVPPRRTYQSSNFANLSPGVQKLLSHVPDQEISRSFSSEENLGFKKSNSSIYRSLRGQTRSTLALNRSNESLDIISPNVQKMLSNLPDTELIISPGGCDKKMTNRSFLHSAKREGCETLPVEEEAGKGGEGVKREGSEENASENYKPVPLGSYLHTSPHGIASRTPVGRKSLGKYLQVPSESSQGTSSSTNSSEVSRPVSLTSIGSCSSSGSSGNNQAGSAYLASAESLDSDPEPSGSQGSADSGIAEQPSVMTAEMRVLQEVLDSEAVYVSDLNEVIEGYLKRWRSEPDCVLAPHLDALFSNIEEIYEFNKKFLDQLRNAEGDSTKIANVFLQNDSGFSVYHEYCQNYPRTMDVIGDLTRDDKMVPIFREKQIALGHALPLGSYLLKPVQRILKYHLLLQRLSKQCEPEHKHVVDLALTTMTGIASDINMMKRKHEHAVRVQEIQSQLYGWNGPALTALGELIAEGTFRVVGARGRRHVFLFDKVFLMTKSKQGGVLAYKFHIMCSNLMLVEQVRGEPLSFQVLPFDNPRLQCTIRARSPQHKREWTLQIKRVILENYSAVIPNHARQLVMQLGQDISEIEETEEKWTPLKHSSNTPHYLERRSRIRKTVDPSGRRAASQDRTFPSLANWRRKSEPGVIPQYTTKTLPHKITKLKKQKAASKFYTDLSDSENCEAVTESTESLASSRPALAGCEELDGGGARAEPDLERIVSDIVNEEFKKLKKGGKRSLRDSEPTPEVWMEEAPTKLPAKADSLPRSFQLNERAGSGAENYHKHVLDKSLKENASARLEDQPENDLTSHIDDSEHPDHKIYRKSAIRVSLLQRIRTLMSEQQKKTSTSPIWKQQHSRSTGERIANPEYVDPQKFILNSSRSSLIQDKVDDLLDEPERLDMTINEDDVMTEIENRLQKSLSLNDTGQLEKFGCVSSLSISSFNSSQNDDSYYESILDDRLVEEYDRDSSGELILKQDSFRSTENRYISRQNQTAKTESTTKSTICTSKSEGRLFERKTMIKRPNKAPPPIPVKPTHLKNGHKKTETIKTYEEDSTNKDICEENLAEVIPTKSWVKAMVGRFE